MHQLFRIAELVELMVQHVAVRAYQPQRRGRQKQTFPLQLHARHDLLSLGLTSKIFLEHALNALWHTQTSLTPLLRIAGVLGAKRIYHYLTRGGVAIVSVRCLDVGAAL